MNIVDLDTFVKSSDIITDQYKQDTLISLSIKWIEIPLHFFFHKCNLLPRVIWLNNGFSFAGAGKCAILKANGFDKFKIIQQKLEKLFENLIIIGNEPSFIGPRLFGGFSFNEKLNISEEWSDFNDAYFVLPKYQLTKNNNQNWLTFNFILNEQQNLDLITKKFYQLQTELNPKSKNKFNKEYNKPNIVKRILMPKNDLQWESNINFITNQINNGELEKIVLARICYVKMQSSLNKIKIISKLEKHNPNCYQFLIELKENICFFGSSPELLANVKNKVINTVALAGTSNCGKTIAEDDYIGQLLMNDPKEREEHNIVVKQINNKLSPLTSNLNISPDPSLFKMKNIQHLKTLISGKLKNDIGILTVIEKLHPTPAVGGQPQDKALNMIERFEKNFSRGWYAGPIGWIDHEGNGTFVVGIRSALNKYDELWLYAGTGIVADSKAVNEKKEIELKFSTILDTLKANEI